MDKIPYVVGIPTKGRDRILQKCVKALTEQTMPPSLILFCNNNEPDTRIALPKTGSKLSTMEIRSGYGTTGACGHKALLEQISQLGFKIAVRWDDDLIPEPDCMEKLVTLVAEGNPAAGGMYPQSSYANGPYTELGVVPDGNNRHIQFFDSIL